MFANIQRIKICVVNRGIDPVAISDAIFEWKNNFSKVVRCKNCDEIIVFSMKSWFLLNASPSRMFQLFSSHKFY